MTALNKKPLLAIAAISITLIMVLTIVGIYKTNEVNDRVTQMTTSQPSINSNYYDQQIVGLQQQLLEMQHEANRNYYDLEHQVTNIDASNNTATFTINFTLKQSGLNEKVSIIYGADNIYSQLDAIRLSTGRYQAVLTLAHNKTYQISYSTVLTTVFTEKLVSINAYNVLKSRFDSKPIYTDTDKTSNATIVSCWFRNRHNGDDNLKVNTALIKLYNKGSLIATIDMLNYRDKTVSENEELFQCFDLIIPELQSLTPNDLHNITHTLTITDNQGIEYDIAPELMLK